MPRLPFLKRAPVRGRIAGALALFGLLVAAAPAHAQERWTPDLMICGQGTTDTSEWVWQRAGDPCASSQPPFVWDSSGQHIWAPDHAAPYLNQPNDFAEVVNPASGNVAAIHHLLVADSWNGRVLRFLDTGSAVTYVGELAPGSFVSPFGVTGDADGNILVADQSQNSVQLFDWNGHALGEPMTRCTGDPNPFSGPWRITITPGTSVTPNNAHGQVLIVDGGDNRVVVCDAQMNFLSSFGGPLDISGGDPGLFSTPTGIAVDQIGHIYVADPNNGRVQVFDGTAPLQLGTAPVWIISNSPDANTTVPDMNYPFGLAVDANGRLLVADAGNNAMYVLDSFANQLKPLNVRIGTASAGNQDIVPPVPPGPPGELQVPANISLDSAGRLMIADVYNMRVQRFSHPLMTVTVTPLSQAVTANGDVVLTVAVQAASGQFTSVIPIAEVLAGFDDLILSSAPVISPDANDPNVPAAATTVTAGQGPTIFTMTFHTTGSGPLAFSVYAGGIPQGQVVRVLAPDGAGITGQLAVGVAAGTTAPTTTPSATGTSVVVGFPPNQVTWYTTAPVVHLATTGNPTPEEIHYKTSPNDLFPPDPNASDFTSCLAPSCDLPAITADGPTVVWYRARSTTPQGPLVESWKSYRVYFDAVKPGVGGYSVNPPANAAGWNNSAFTISYSLFTGLVGLPKNTNGHPLVPNPSTIVIATDAQHSTDSASIDPKVTITDAAGKTSGLVSVGGGVMFKLDTVAPTLSNLAVAAPVPLNSFSFYDLTGQPNAGVTVTATAGDTLSGVENVCYDLTGGVVCSGATNVGAGNFSVTVMSSVTNARIWAIDAAGNASAAQTFSVKITRTRPAAVNDAASTNEDVPLSGFTVLANDTDVEGDPLTAVLVGTTSHGALTLNANGSFTYTPAANYGGPDSFTYKATDGRAYSNLATVSLQVAAVNDAPVANDLAIYVTPGRAVNGLVIATDVDNGTLNYTVSASPVFGTLTAFNPATGAFTYAANPTSVSADSFKVTASDGSFSSTATVSVTVGSANGNPVCTAAFTDPARLWPPNHRFVTIAIKGVTDPDGDAVTLAINKIWQDESTLADGSGDTPLDGIILGSTAQVRAERAGTGDGRIYQIFFTATDARGGSCAGSATVGVPHDQSGQEVIDSGVRYDSLVAGGPIVAGTPPNRPPAARGDSASTLKSVATTIAVLANDSDPDGNALTVTGATQPAHGTVAVNANGTITYTSASGYEGSDRFIYTVGDGHGGTAMGNVTIAVSSHSDGDGCERDRHTNGQDGDSVGSDHDRDTRRRSGDHHEGDRRDDDNHRDGDDRRGRDRR